MILLPGSRSERLERRSQLAFFWHAKDATLVPVTGQTSALINTGTPALTGGAVTPRYGAEVVAGKGMPRFGYDPETGLNYLALSGTTAGQDVESLTYQAALPARSLSVLLRFRGLWTPGATFASAAGLFSLGLTTVTGAGTLQLNRHTGSSYRVVRQNASDFDSATLAESGTQGWPADALVTYNGALGRAELSLRSTTGVVTGPVSCGGAAYASAARWGGNALSLGSNYQFAAGAPIWLYWCKIALGVKTFQQLDVMV